jgi:hypothetical protein
LLASNETLEQLPPWSPQLGPQTDAIEADWCPEILFGGAAGGGKSDFLLGDFLQDVPTYAQAWRGVMFRRTYPELEELIARAHELYPQSGAVWSEQKKLWTWGNGAVLRMRYIERDLDALRYQGHQYTWIGFDELTQWPSLYGYKYLRTRLRSAHNVPSKRMRSSANPGGPGHSAVKSYFIDPAPGGFVPIVDPDTQLERMFIPSKLKDNALLQKNDPLYERRLMGAGSTALVRALLDGDWSVIEGAFFDCWNSSRHVIRPFTIPTHWTRFRSCDWGSAKPFSVGWWAIVSEPYRTEEGVTLPRGCMVRYREWYGSKSPNVGLKLHAEVVAEGIKDREKEDEIDYGVIDPAAFQEDGGPSIAERMFSRGVSWRRADNARVAQRGAMGGWDFMRSRLVGDHDGNPMVVAFSTCVDSIRTIPALQHDRDKAEDLDTNAEDHAADEWRYGIMSRPWVRELAPPVEDKVKAMLRQPSMDELVNAIMEDDD